MISSNWKKKKKSVIDNLFIVDLNIDKKEYGLSIGTYTFFETDKFL